jgi:hypothetical protein
VPDQLISQPVEENRGLAQKNQHATAKPLVVRTLKDPPEIWELVHEAPEHFKPGSAFVTRLTSSKTNLVLLMLAVILISGLSTFAVMRLRDRQRADTTAEVQQARVTSQTVPASQTRDPASALNEPVSAPVNAATSPLDAHLNSQLNTTPSAAAGVDNTPPQPTNLQSTASQPPDTKSIAQPDNPASAGNALTNNIQPTGVNVSNISKRTASRASRGQNADKRPARGESETAASRDAGASPQPPPTADLKNLNEKNPGDSASPKKKSDTSPQSIAPAATNSTSKPKVIQWP